jgi:hypothetical protein
VLDPEEGKLLGVDFDDGRFGELIYLMRPGCLIHPSHMGRYPWAGMHGFHPDEPSSFGVLMAREAPPVHVEGIQDVFALMCQAAGIRSESWRS